MQEPSVKDGSARSANNHTAMGLRALSKLGIPVNLDKETVERIGKLHARISAYEVDPVLEEKIMNLEDVDFVSKQHGYFFAKYAMMTDKQFDEMLADMRELKKLLGPVGKTKSGQA
jgi:hypothetical protein